MKKFICVFAAVFCAFSLFAKERSIKISVGGVELEGVLYDTVLAEEIAATFPFTLPMVRYGGREYYGGVDFYPKNAKGGQKHFANGDITYCIAHHNMAIFFAQTDNNKSALSSAQIKNYSKISGASFRKKTR